MESAIGLVILVIVILAGIAVIAIKSQNKKDKQEKDRLSAISLNIKNQLDSIGFKTSKSYEYKSYEALVDTTNKKVVFTDKEKGIFRKFDFSELLNCEIIQDNNIIMSGGVGRALVGGFVAGGVGAIVGATTRDSKNVVFEMKLRITSRDINDPLYVIRLINEQVERDSDEYKLAINFAESIYATIESIIKQQY